MQFQYLVICATFCAIWTTLVTTFSKSLSMFIMSTLEVGFAPILRQFRAISIVCHLCQFLSHLDHFSDNIFKIFVHIHNQHIRNRFYTKFEIILCNFNIWSFVPLLCHLDNFSDNIFKIFVHIHNQHIRNRFYTKFEIILCNFNIWSFVPLFVPFGQL